MAEFLYFSEFSIRVSVMYLEPVFALTFFFNIYVIS